LLVLDILNIFWVCFLRMLLKIFLERKFSTIFSLQKCSEMSDIFIIGHCCVRVTVISAALCNDWEIGFMVRIEPMSSQKTELQIFSAFSHWEKTLLSAFCLSVCLSVRLPCNYSSSLSFFDAVFCLICVD